MKGLTLKTIMFSVVILLLFSGCSAKNILTQEGKNVRTYDRLPENLECEYKDEIIGSEADMWTFLFISNRDMTAGARADLRNQAVKLGGNSVLIQNSEFVYTTSTVFIGHVYHCHEK